MQTVAEHKGNYWVLNGTKAWVTNGIEGGAIIVIARSDLSKRHKGISAFIVPTNTPGIFKLYFEFTFIVDVAKYLKSQN